jgi:hypothetical protein
MRETVNMRVTRLAIGLAAVGVFLVLVTANAGGYRYGVSDQAFYVPAVSLGAFPELFPRDRAVFEPQMRLWLGDEILGAVVRYTGVALPVLFGAIYVATVAIFVANASLLGRSLGLGWPSLALALVVMTLRHRIAKTGANSFEGYMHPRMLAFAIGLGVLAAVVRRRWGLAVAGVALAAVVHSSTAIWFAAVVAVAIAWLSPHRRPLMGAAATIALLAALVGPSFFAARVPAMDEVWLGVLADRDYLFSLEWPAYAWVFNLGYVVLLTLGVRRRAALGLVGPGERAVFAGAFGLAVIFAATLPGTAVRAPFFVTLQANRVFWLLDALLAIVGSWWLMEDLPRRTHRHAGIVVLALTALFSAGRGAYVVTTETSRTLVQPALPSSTWTDTMAWLRTQPAAWHVLADPGHAWKFGASVRAAALRDVLLESGKDPAMAMYDRPLAVRVADRSAALGSFEALTLDRLRALDTTYDLDVFIDETWRRFDLPELYRNRDFVAYDLR